MVKCASRWRNALVPLVCGALVVGLAGCFGGTVAGSDRAACGGASKATGGPLVILLAQQGADRLGLRDSGRAAVGTVVDAAAAMEARTLVAGMGDGREPAAVSVDTRLAGEGPNDMLRSRALTCRIDLVRGGYERIATQQPPPRLDLISALRDLSAGLPSGQEGTVDLVVVGSALNTAGADLREAAVRKSPARSINRLARRGLNFRCDGWRVHLVGGGLDGGGAIDPVAASQLREWWRRYFEHCGGALVLFASRLTEFPVRSGALAPADRSLIPIEIERRGDAVEATLSGDVLFASNSAALEAGAGTVLRRLLPAIEVSRGTIEVAGHTDSTGTAAVNLPLSWARARTVAAWLRDVAGVAAARIRVRGHGAAEPVAGNGTEEGRAKNRRVVVTMTRRAED